MNVLLDLVEIENVVRGEMSCNRNKLKCYGSCLVVSYMPLAGIVDSDVSWSRRSRGILCPKYLVKRIKKFSVPAKNIHHK